MSVAKNATFMTVASVGQKIIAFLYFTFLARQLGTEDIGRYFLALSFTTIFVIFIDLGFTSVLVREAARQMDRAQKYLSTLLAFKLLMAVVVYIACSLAAHLLGYDEQLIHLIYLSGVTMILDTLHLTLYGILRARGQLQYESAAIVASQAITLVLGTFFVYSGLGLIWLIAAFTFPSALNLLYASWMLKRQGFTLRPTFDKESFHFLARIAVPFAVAAIFARLYSYIDSILLSKFMGEVAVGLYSIPYKITFAFQFVPLALIAALYPRFSEYFVSDRQKLAITFERGVKYLLLVSMPIAFGIATLSQDIIHTLYTSEFDGSILPLQILIFGLIFSYLSFPIGSFLNACNRQVTQTIIIAIVMVVNIILNVELIPRFGVVGAALSATLGNILLAILGLFFALKVTNISLSYILTYFLRTLMCALIMSFVVFWVNQYMHFSVSILAGALTYIVAVFATQTVTKHQIKELYLLIRR
ncbi:flippase [Candidatus Nomurabacteria bacterium]|nr:flippase [Candidatus Nomurabacteria bacterium]